MHYCLANDLPTLVWAANLADLELHTSLSRKNKVERPTMMVFDLDPGAPADIVQCCQVGIWLRQLLDGMKLKAFAKTSGSKGLQMYVPLNTAVTYDQTKGLSRSLAQRLEREHPDRVTSNMEFHNHRPLHKRGRGDYARRFIDFGLERSPIAEHVL